MTQATTAHYQCVHCQHMWWGLPAPQMPDGKGNPPAKCPKCGSLYMTWLNFEGDSE